MWIGLGGLEAGVGAFAGFLGAFGGQEMGTSCIRTYPFAVTSGTLAKGTLVDAIARPASIHHCEPVTGRGVARPGVAEQTPRAAGPSS